MRRGRPSVSDSTKKKKELERKKRFRETQKAITVSVETAGEIRRIGAETNKTDKEVISLLLQT